MVEYFVAVQRRSKVLVEISFAGLGLPVWTCDGGLQVVGNII
jgi:hypothetical protein